LLSPTEKAAQEALAEKIVTQIVKTEKSDQLSTLAKELKIALAK
jgi:hypothetical protein